MATYKSQVVENMLSADASGRLRQLHDDLIGLGLKTKISSNTDTLLFEAATPKKDRVGIAAMRPGVAEIFSFPRPYWIGHVQELDAALSQIDKRHLIETEGFVSASQYSLRQVRISEDTFSQLRGLVQGIIRPKVAEVRGEV
jgi:hypothetical protein